MVDCAVLEREGLPLSFAQQQLWLVDRMQPGSSLYNIPSAFRLSGRLDVRALSASWTDIVRRHEILRTTFADRDGVPTQRVSAAAEVPIPVLDLGGLPATERENEVIRRITEEAATPFDLANGPLLRVSLLRVSDEELVLLVTVHHIVFDGTSLGILLRELGRRYAAHAGHGSSLSLPELPMQYADFSVWQREQRMDEHLVFWKRKFADLPPRLQLWTDRPRPPVQTHRGANVRFEVPQALQEQVAELSAAGGTTPFITLLAAFQVLLARYTGQHDVVVGVPVFGRPRDDLDGLIGCFANTVAVRVDLSGDPTFREVLARVADETMDAFEHMDVQFDKVVEAVEPERDPSYMPLVQMTFGLLTEDVVGSLKLPGLTVEELDVRRGTAKFDLSLDLACTAGSLSGDLEYNVDLYDEATVTRFAGHWQSLLAAAVADPDIPMSALPLLTPEERVRMLVEWNRSDTDFADPQCMHELFETQARRTPDTEAVVFGDERMTYRQVDEQANQLAHLLRLRGVGTETSVGVCMARSARTIVAFLAVLKAGGVYVPLDPEYPAERLAFMLSDAQVALLVADSEVTATLPTGDVATVLLDVQRAEIGSHPTTAPRTPVTPDNLSCMFYTSGSSGMPKCAMLTHANYFNYVQFWYWRYLRETPMKVHLQMTSFAFDIFIADTTRALFTGAVLVICPREVVMAPARLYELMVRENVNSAEFITPILAALVDHVEEHGETLEFLDILVAGSDIWYAADFMRTRRLCGPRTRMIAAYGLSETSIDNATFDGGDVHGEIEGIVPIGRPVANTRLYVLTEHMQPLPAGLAGELHVGGLGVGRGYLRRPGLTAQRYVPDPFSAEPGARLYKSGDLARYRPDGVLEILGRVDNQVKVGGFRIELGEIESALRRHPLIDSAVVVVHETSANAKQLVGYMTFAGDADPAEQPGGLREFLQSRLPGYMVPSVMIKLDELPLNANGKVDRRALPAPTESLIDAEAAHLPARTPTEEIIAGIWAEVLERTDRIGVHDNFFAAGGRSLLMTQVVSRIRSVWQVDLPVRAVYKYPTVASLARQVELLRAEGRRSPAPPVTRTDRRDGTLFETSYAQQQLWFHDQLDPDSPTYNVPAAFRLRGELDADALNRAVQSLVDRHEILRTVYVAVAGLPRQRVLDAQPCVVSWTDLSPLPADDRQREVESQVQQEERHPFDLSTGPLIRVSVLRLAPDEHVLLVTMHHVVTDGWSMAIAFGELSALYAAELRGEPAGLPEPSLQYLDYAVWQRGRCNDEAVAEHASYWRAKLDGAPAVVNLPSDRAPSAVCGHDGAFCSFTLPPELAAQLGVLSRTGHATLFMTLMAAFQVLLARCTGQHDILVGAPTSGRSQVEVERLIGFFVNVLPLRTDLSGDPTFRQVLGNVREAALEAYEHQDLPFEKVVELVGPPRAPFRNPVFQTVFALEHVVGENLVLPGLAVEEIPFETTTAKFDLLLEMTETSGGLRGGFSYKTDLFDEATIVGMIDRWRNLLAGIVARPDAPISTLPLSEGDPAELGLPAAPAFRHQPEHAGQDQADEYVAPRTPIEWLVASVWAEVLTLPRVSVYSDFFELGGYSLLGSRLAASLEALLDVQISVRSLFENPTVELLAGRIEAAMTGADKARITELLDHLSALSDDDVLEQLAHE